jgi:transcriptional regulator with XRE-family HTH domain
MNEPKPWLIVPGGLAERLRELQDAADITGKDLAEQLGWAPSKVSRIRQGIITPSQSDIEAWAQATGAAGAAPELLELRATGVAHERTFKDTMARGQAEVQRIHNQMVEDSQVIRYFDTVWIPGLVQTRDYARAVFAEMVELHRPPKDIDEAVAARMKRQHLLYDQSKRFEILIGEPALLWDWVPARVMVPQLHFLATWLDAPNVRLGLLPMRGGNRRVPQHGFQMYDDLVVVETFDGEDSREAPDLYVEVMDAMWEQALTGEDARAFLAKTVKAWEA